MTTTSLSASLRRTAELVDVIEDYIERGSPALSGRGLSRDDTKLVQMAAKNAPFLTLPSLTEDEVEAQIRATEAESHEEPGA